MYINPMKNGLKKFTEAITEKILLFSSGITTLTVILIVIFLFKEGMGLFSSPDIEEGYVLAVNQENPINQLTPEESMEVFDSKITSWKELGGKEEDILVFRLSDVTNYADETSLGDEFQFLPHVLDSIITVNPGIIAFIPQQYIDSTFTGKILNNGHITAESFFDGKYWYPTASPSPLFGLLPLISGTLWISLFAILIALPFGLAVAIYMAELANQRTRKIIKPIIELLAGIPSVVYGFFGLVVLVPLVQKVFNLPVGESGLVGSIILAIMALPTIITVAEDAIRTTPRSMREASLALGANHWQTIYKVVLPYSMSGITAAAVLGIGRAIGETMAVLMVSGNAAIIPSSLLEPMRTIPATIAAELGEAPVGGIHYKALFLLGCILFILTLITSISVELINTRKKA